MYALLGGFEGDGDSVTSLENNIFSVLFLRMKELAMKFRGISFVDLLLMFRILFGMFIPSIQMEGVSFQEMQL